ncbi:alpha/beta hydrolase [Jannaschia ovalis]|uniref:Alpha/beta hydrolase n=1 Tax=Jannaschia ovalis TaxID=3038773 RepID=A0ABY8LF70_9RHOB|nr:alpha/beta hydrolase [Jannaschia sp. GRR-S6-38]WGH79053.1 alpha/beta hydrolase [Jannaschia sp. GRR-S6-38]
MAEGPVPEARWIETRDGLRLRAALWPEGTRGTVVMFQGRTEYIEKYSDAARHLAERGFAAAALDWQGQGLSTRSQADRRIGHVNDFNDFQTDVDAFLDHCAARRLPRPWHLLGHSMGGAIGLRALLRVLPFERAVFSAPMWGLKMLPQQRILGWTVSALGSSLGLSGRLTPGSGKVADPASQPFEGNLLTSDPEMFAWMKAQIQAHPDLALGGPSIGWLWSALREMHALARAAAPDVPTLTLLGTEEGIVDPDAIHVRMASWPKGALEMVEGARHEVLMEGAATRARLYDRIAAHLDG